MDLPSDWQPGVDKALKEIEAKNPKIKQAEIKGRPHKSTTDPSDPDDVVSVRLRDGEGKRVETAHVDHPEFAGSPSKYLRPGGKRRRDVVV
ncbi:hypothetical protein BST61_g7059 [Cercospora zeina]